MKLDMNSVTQAIRARQKQLGLWVSLSNNDAAETNTSLLTQGADSLLEQMKGVM